MTAGQTAACQYDNRANDCRRASERGGKRRFVRETYPTPLSWWISPQTWQKPEVVFLRISTALYEGNTRRFISRDDWRLRGKLSHWSHSAHRCYSQMHVHVDLLHDRPTVKLRECASEWFFQHRVGSGNVNKHWWINKLLLMLRRAHQQSVPCVFFGHKARPGRIATGSLASGCSRSALNHPVAVQDVLQQPYSTCISNAVALSVRCG